MKHSKRYLWRVILDYYLNEKSLIDYETKYYCFFCCLLLLIIAYRLLLKMYIAFLKLVSIPGLYIRLSSYRMSFNFIITLFEGHLL